MSKRILIVEDEESIADLEKDYLELSGFEVEVANDGVARTGSVYTLPENQQFREPCPKLKTQKSLLRRTKERRICLWQREKEIYRFCFVFPQKKKSLFVER